MGKDKDNRRALLKPGSQVMSNPDSLAASLRPSRLGFIDKYAVAMQTALELRQSCRMIHDNGTTKEDLTPHFLTDVVMDSKIMSLSRRLDWRADTDLSSQRFLSEGTIHGIEDNFRMSVSSNAFSTSDPIELESHFVEEEEEPIPQLPKTPPYIKIMLRKTSEILLFENQSITVPRGTTEAQEIEEDNKFYDFITIGKGRMRRTNTAETQTVDKFYKSRDTNTALHWSVPNEAHVSNFLMFHSFKNADSFGSYSPIESSDRNFSLTKTRKSQYLETIKKNEFKVVLMSIQRILAGNVFESQQLRFRNLIMPDPIARDCKFKYRLKLLLRFNPVIMDRSRKSVADLAVCPGNGDIIAVAYGIYSFGSMHVPENGYCCIWNIKNPVNPERKYVFKAPVVSVQFSPFTPQLLAIGMYDGSIEIRDISTLSGSPVAVSVRTKISNVSDPILGLEWISQGYTSAAENTEIEPLLALSQDSRVTKYRIINSPYLLGFKQMQLDQVEGTIEGLKTKRNWNQTQSNRYPQGLGIKKHPNQHDIYYIFTDEGCIHKCSTNYPHQHLEVLQAHVGAVNEMDFSPWSPKLFLTAGNDWCIRIWMDGILEPLITLKYEVGPVHCAAWSKTHSTIIVSNTRRSIDIWDIRRSTLNPVSSTTIDKSYCTMFRFSRCGRSLVLGNERGSVLIVGLDDMPFPPHFQYNELELAIYRAVALKPNLTTELKSVGFFGYPEQNQIWRRKRAHHCTLVQ